MRPAAKGELSGQSYYFDVAESLSFSEETVSCLNFPLLEAPGAHGQPMEHTYGYVVETVDDLCYITFSDGKRRATYLALQSDDMLLLCPERNSAQAPLQHAVYGCSKWYMMEWLYTPKKQSVHASSELREGAVTYSAANVCDLGSDTAWAEGAAGQGEGEYIALDGVCASGMYVVPGYVSYDKPWLWRQNSRPQKLDISCDGKQIISAELTDSPVPQYIDFGGQFEGDFRLTIRGVYPGTKYDDTCISTIIISR